MNELPLTLADWLAHCERLHRKTIDLSLERVARVKQRLALDFEVPLFTIGGTNGKGSTCAMLEAILLQSGWRVGVHTSPHLVRFEERCRINGEIVDGAALLPHFAAVEEARGDEELTFFEFTLLVILRHFASQPLDAVVLEVGLGGRLDAVNAFDTDCAILTSIDLDHMEYLGPDRESIGREKVAIARPGRPLIVGDPVPPQAVLDHAAAIGAELWRFGVDFNYSGDKQQWNWAGRARRHAGLAYPALRGANQLLNASGVLAALEAMRDRLPVTAQAVRNGLALVELPGRFQIVPGEPTLVLDVAHNPHAVATLAANLDQMGFYPRTHAVFGAMADKDLDAMLERMLPLVDAWHLPLLPTARAALPAALRLRLEAVRESLRQRGAVLPPDAPIHEHADPAAALRAAVAGADPADRILVFGSFYTVGGVLEHGVPRLTARHLS
ncbi:bifunctional tetrahydrofolate synthase/dihydrofolate synthase [Rivibacter subsaxonicus]|uniref:Dihydrofolate synthase/folylpolyglutamate synthase n=1 Tax=Rivibacter subsaxonicus TaxID=457575 RepID=A0A4Q7VP52_9BURK|nr:bifunctional tetrahydrofolate synthase/dihydrofolate synthase [Rivibacter subsaxonicus]RZT98129.1 dihydrofolate synthase/folylpolyglutamate synthase [Rivibacter subsaxonicus]